MATDSTSQHFPVIAKDLLIAALEAKVIIPSGATPTAKAANLGEAYVALLDRIKSPAAQSGND